MLNNVLQRFVLCLQHDDLLLEANDFLLPPFEIDSQFCTVDNTSLLFKFLICLLQLIPVLLKFTLIILLVVQLLIQLNQLDLLNTILLVHILKLFSCMRQNNHSLGDFLSKLVQFLISLLNLLIQGLVLNFELLKIDQMEAICQLLLLLEDLLLVSKLVP